MSLLGSRRFLGDYIGLNASTGPGSMIRGAIQMSNNEKVLFSCRGEILEAKFGRSSKLSPRILVVTNSKFYVVAQALAGGQAQILVEKSVPLGAIKFIGTSTCRDDWFSLGIGSPQEPDPLLTCVFKTELFTQMQRVMPGGFSLKISESIEYAKKPGKMQLVKVLKDSPQAVDFYKSGAIHTQPGEPPSSGSRPTPKGKPVPPRPITRGKLIKPGGPNGRPSRLTGNRAAAKRPAPAAQTMSRPVPTPAAVSTPAATTTLPSHTRNQNSGSTRAPPPPPPPAAAPAAAAKPTAKVLYDFAGQRDNELTVRAGDIVEIVQKENNGWWLAKNSAGQAWVPAAYVEEQAPPPPPAATSRAPPPPPNGRAKPAAPQPPAKRPVPGNKRPGAAPQPRDSGYSLAANGSDSSRSNTPTPSLAGSLADALKARQSAMSAKKADDDDW